MSFCKLFWGNINHPLISNNHYTFKFLSVRHLCIGPKITINTSFSNFRNHTKLTTCINNYFTRLATGIRNGTSYLGQCATQSQRVNAISPKFTSPSDNSLNVIDFLDDAGPCSRLMYNGMGYS